MNDMWTGMLFIGDPHLTTLPHVPACRTSDYPNHALDKLTFCLDYARVEKLLPVLLGDLFHRPRGLKLGLLCSLLDLLKPPMLTIYGNHDRRDAVLGDDDPLTVLVKAGRLQRVDQNPWRGCISDRQILVGGTSYGHPLPVQSMREPSDALAVWITHHDLALAGFERYSRATDSVEMVELPGVDIAVNGHYHRRHEHPLVLGQTHWFNPGNICRVRRDERDHCPTVLRIDITATSWQHSWVKVEHLPFEQVCTDRDLPEQGEETTPEFISGLVRLVSRPGGVAVDLEEHLRNYSVGLPQDVQEELWSLLKEVRGHGRE